MKRVAAAALLALLAACSSSPRVPSVNGHISEVSEIGPSAAAALEQLCPKPPTPLKRITPMSHVPSVVSTTEREVEAVRGLPFEHPVAVAAVTRHQMASRIDKASVDTLPLGQIHRQGLAWETIGAIPKGTDLADAARRFLATQVVGYYDEQTKELVFVGSTHPTPIQRFTLAHELTHALDDQHFDLTRFDRLQATCRDDEVEAATGAIEGSAVFFSSLVVERYFSPSDRRQVERPSGSVPKGIPQFLIDMESWPYLDGPRFISSLAGAGGTSAVNNALRDLPVSTSQVMHPSLYPGPRPAPLDIPQLARDLGKGWRDLDVEEVGEQWLDDLLGLRLDPTVAGPAVEGWDGGLYRAWTDGTHVAVLLRTRWGTDKDATQFTRAINGWIRPDQAAQVNGTGSVVDVLFASDSATLTQIENAVGE
jgi:uncharacterized protein DUF955